MEISSKKNSILIVDDEKANIIALTHILSAEYTIYAAKNGQDAVNIAKEHTPDVVLLDILMPGMNGFEVFAQLSNNDKTKDIPVIFVTGLGNPENEEKGLAMGAADYISKPFIPAIVKLRVRHQVELQNQIYMIKHLSVTDQLTGISNRRNFDYRLSFEWEHNKRGNNPLSILMMDIDNFKNYNDSFGHQQGDVALRSMAKAIEGSINRAVDFAARWGGEEFAVLLPDTTPEGAMKVGEIIRKNVEDMIIPCDDARAAKITVSVGVNTIYPLSGGSIDAFISGADAALYEAKKAGKNRVCHNSPK